MEIKDILKLLRKKYSFTQKQIAAKLHLGERNYQYFESGAVKPSFETLENLIDVYDIPADFLFSRGVFTKTDMILNCFEYLLKFIAHISIPECPEISNTLQNISAVSFGEQLKMIAFLIKDINLDGNNLKINLTVK